MAEQIDGTAPYLFLSYTTPDRARVLALADRLAATGIHVWVDRRSLVGGQSWDAAIVRAIKNCAVFVVCCTPAAVASPNVTQELRLAWEEQRPTLPLLLAPVSFPDEMRYILAGRQWIDTADRPEEAGRAILAEAARLYQDLGKLPAPLQVTAAAS